MFYCSSHVLDLAPTMSLPIKNTFINFDEIPSLPLEITRVVTGPPCLERRNYTGDCFTDCNTGDGFIPGRGGAVVEEDANDCAEDSSQIVDLNLLKPCMMSIKNTFINFDEVPSLTMERTKTCPPCLGPRDSSEDCLTDCSTDDELDAWPDYDPRANEMEQGNAKDANEMSEVVDQREEDDQDAKSQLDIKDVTHTAIDAMDATGAADDWQQVNRRHRKKPAPVAKSAPEVLAGPQRPSAVSATLPVPTSQCSLNTRMRQQTRERWIHCRFEVGIKDSSDFRVCRRLIGAGGENIKYIVEESGGAKVRVDTKEPVMVRVSAPSRASLDSAATLVSDLLSDVQEEYREFCSRRGRPVPRLKVVQQTQQTGVC